MRFVFLAALCALAVGEVVYELPQQLGLWEFTFANPSAPWPRYVNTSLITFWRMGDGPFLDATWNVGQYTGLATDGTDQIGFVAAKNPVAGQNTASTVQWQNSTVAGESGTLGVYLNTALNPPQAGQDLRCVQATGGRRLCTAGWLACLIAERGTPSVSPLARWSSRAEMLLRCCCDVA